MKRIDVARRYFERVVVGDGATVASLFTDDGAIDDYAGRHHSGRAAIQAFIDAIDPGMLTFQAPLHHFEETDRLIVYGRVLRPGETEFDDVRWVFHFRGESVSHLCNSKIFELPAEIDAG